MANDPTEDVVKREIAEAARILREDNHGSRLARIEEKLNKHFPDEPEDDPDNDKDPKAPDKKDEPNDPEPRKKGLWWGDQSDE